MKVCLVAHGYPPELVGGTEVSVQNLARGLAERGVDVVVVAGSMEHEQGFRLSDATDGDVRVRRIHRADLYFDHWQKSSSARVAEAFAAILSEERPDLVHVHHWIRLSRDLIHTAALAGIPAVATLHDLWTTCLITFRVRPDTKKFCEATLGPSPCLSCAALVPPRTPWVSMENQFMAINEHRRELVRELETARAVIVPSRAHAEAVQRFLAIPADDLSVRVIPNGRDLMLERRAARSRDPGRLVLGAWGHLHPLKGQDLLLAAMRSLPDPSAIRIHFAGGEPDAEFAARLREEARGLDVTFHGAYDASGLDSHPVSDVDAMISGTRAHESWGLVIDEAVALGLPMILPRSGAYAERLREAEGALFYDARDTESLAAVLTRVLEDPALLESVASRLPRLEDVAPSLAQHVSAVQGVYDEVVALGPPEKPDVDWWGGRMRIAAEEEWDEGLKKRTAAELGFE